jgi:hypothetical protein
MRVGSGYKRLGRKGRVIASRFHLHVLRTKTEVRNAVQYVLRNAERHGLHEAWPGWHGGPGKGTAALGMPRPDPLSTAAWFPYWAERELLVAPTQIPASVVRPAQCYLMQLAFEGASLSFAAPDPQRAFTRKGRRSSGGEFAQLANSIAPAGKRYTINIRPPATVGTCSELGGSTTQPAG